MKTTKAAFHLFAAALALLLAGCGGDKVGESCATEGALTDECGDGAVCARSAADSALACHVLCERDDQCAAGEKCAGLTGSGKACLPAE